MKTIHIIAGVRPNFVKAAALYHAFKDEDWVIPIIVHTGQHYDINMSDTFFRDLEIPDPHICLNVNGGTHSEQVGNIMVAYERALMKNPPDMVAVVGDANSTMACAVTAKKAGIALAHIEAGLRSRDLTMPEEINRIITDSISDFCFVTEKSGVSNLTQEGKVDNVFLVGNVMVDTLFRQLPKLNGNNASKPFAIATLHRPANVDNETSFKDIWGALVEISQDMPIIFPVHPRTKVNMSTWDVSIVDTIELTPPKPYMDFLGLWKDAALAITDSGGLQEETTALKVPCFTVRENTERPITIDEGTNTLVGTTKKSILDAYENFKNNGPKNGIIPKLWDGKAAVRIASIIKGLI